MKKSNILIPVIAFIVVSCSPPKKTPVEEAPKYDVADSVLNYDPQVQARPKSFLKELTGKWNIYSMRRQQKLPSENLSAVTIEFRTDSTFGGKAPCNGMNGNYELKGAGIRLFNLIVTDMACDDMSKENAFLNLLSETVSAFTINGDTLLLRDVASNIVFEAKRASGN